VYLNLQAATPELVSCWLGEKNWEFSSKIIQGVPPKLSGSSATTTLQWSGFPFWPFASLTLLTCSKKKKSGQTDVD
jgi:hypothetical protein